MKNFWIKSGVRRMLLSVLVSLSVTWTRFTKSLKNRKKKEMMTEEEIRAYLDSLSAVVFEGKDYEEYKLLMIEEAKDILSSKEKYITSNPMALSSKISRLNDLIDFFTIQEEDEIVKDLNMVKSSIKLRFYLKEFV